MMQIAGLTLITVGSVLLGLSIFQWYLKDFMRFQKWDNLPWESKIELRLFGVKGNNFLENIIKSNEKWPIGKEPKNPKILERIIF